MVFSFFNFCWRTRSTNWVRARSLVRLMPLFCLLLAACLLCHDHCTVLPTNRFVSTTKISMKCVVNWIPLRIRVRSRNTQPHLNKYYSKIAGRPFSFFKNFSFHETKILRSKTPFLTWNCNIMWGRVFWTAITRTYYISLALSFSCWLSPSLALSIGWVRSKPSFLEKNVHSQTSPNRGIFF